MMLKNDFTNELLVRMIGNKIDELRARIVNYDKECNMMMEKP